MKVLKPQCVPNGIREFAYSATGYIVPCCICDNAHHHDKKNDPLHNNLFKEHLHLDNAESLDDIFLSKEWINFVDSLNSYETAPLICKGHCGIEKEIE
jgi:hypothetical protein|tara:strand:+ start:170 stop:463 length:294 start_codon:yes stop_codon:yes gene_type:complete